MPGWRCRSAWARWSTPAGCSSACAAPALYTPAPGWPAFALRVLLATRADRRRCCAGPRSTSTGSRLRAPALAAHRPAGRLPGAARSLLYFACLLASGLKLRQFVAPRLNWSAWPVRCTSRRPTALDYFAVAGGRRREPVAGRGGGRDRAGRVPRARHAGRARRDRHAGRAAAGAASRPTPCRVQRLRWLNRFFFQELGFAGNVNDYYDPDNSYLHRVLAHAPRHPDHAGGALHRAGHADRPDGARRVLPRPLPGQAEDAAGRGGDRSVHRPVAVARGTRRTARCPTSATAACWASSTRRSACSCRRRRRATCSRACCAT